MTDTHIATALLRRQFQFAHDWLAGTMTGVTNEVAAWQPQGRANPIGAQYVHHLVAEDALINGMITGGTPLMAGAYAGKTGMSAPPPIGDWGDWAREVSVDVEAARQYAQAVYAATDAYVASLSDGDLRREHDLSAVGLGVISLGAFLSTLIANCNNHCGEISCLKGLQGMQGYPM
jgi:hypothetical protein